MKYLLAGLLLLAVPALADDASQKQNGDTFGTPCDYPPSALAQHAQGNTLLSYRGGADGSIDMVTVAASSGHSDLDQAGAACVSRWRFDPSSPYGEKLRGQHQTNIRWKIPVDGTKPHGDWVGIPHHCNPYYPPTAVAAHEAGTVRVGFTITAHGRVRDPAVVTSSGFADLDAAALTCVTHWRYLPAIKDDKPVDVPWQADIKWEWPEPVPPPATVPPLPATPPPVSPPKP